MLCFVAGAELSLAFKEPWKLCQGSVPDVVAYSQLNHHSGSMCLSFRV